MFQKIESSTEPEGQPDGGDESLSHEAGDTGEVPELINYDDIVSSSC